MKFAHINIEDVVTEIEARIANLDSAIAVGIEKRSTAPDVPSSFDTVIDEIKMRRLELQGLLDFIKLEEEVRSAKYAKEFAELENYKIGEIDAETVNRCRSCHEIPEDCECSKEPDIETERRLVG